MYTATQVIQNAQEQGLFDNYAHDYAEPGYSLAEGKKGILFANWNDSARYGEASTKRSKLMSRLAEVAERVGYEIEWYDEWTTCNECYRAIRTSPDSYDYMPSYVLVERECAIYCKDCMLGSESLFEEWLHDEIVGKSERCLQLDCDEMLGKLGYVKVEDDLEYGFNYNSEMPVDIATRLRKEGITEFIFKQEDASQFQLGFSLWVHKDDVRRLK